MIGIRRAFALLILGCAAATGALAQGSQASLPADIRIVSMPEDETNRGLLSATWIMVIANILLCGVTWIAARSQSKDMRDSIAVSEKAADAAGRSADAAGRSSDAASASAQLAARQKREMLERETNIVAHRVATIANRVTELASLRIGLSNQIFRDFDSMPEKQKVDEILARTKEAAARASAVLESNFAPKPDEVIGGELRQLDQYLVRLEAFKEQLADENFDLRRVIRENQESARRFQDQAERNFDRMRR
jgi:hypothetical protein